MNSIFIILKKIRNNLPYLLLILLYFFFVNLEASKENDNNKIIVKPSKLPAYQTNVDEIERKVSIPVIPYK